MAHPATLDSLEPDAFAAVCAHLRHREVAALAASCAALRHAVATNDRLWASLYQRQFPQPWARLTQRQVVRQGPQNGGGGVAPGAWRQTFLRTHDACHQVRGRGGAASGAGRLNLSCALMLACSLNLTLCLPRLSSWLQLHLPASPHPLMHPHPLVACS